MGINYDLLYLIMVGLFLVAGVLLMLWNRGRENSETGNVRDPAAATAKKSRFHPEPPEIHGRGGIESFRESKIDVKTWYYSIDGRCKHGPVTEDELCRLLNSRRLLPDTLVWTQELPHWSEASSFEYLMTSQESPQKSGQETPADSGAGRKPA